MKGLFLVLMFLTNTAAFSEECKIEPMVRSMNGSIIATPIVSEEWKLLRDTVGARNINANVDSWEDCYKLAKEEVSRILGKFELEEYEYEECYLVRIRRRNAFGLSWSEKYNWYLSWNYKTGNAKGRVNCLTDETSAPEKGDKRIFSL